MATYAEHRQRQRDWEREQYLNASKAEKAERHRQRRTWLFHDCLIDRPHMLERVTRCPNCWSGMPRICWPRYFDCSDCGIVIVDMDSHRTCGAGESIYRMVH
jgi:hypothetical protein